VLWISTLCGHPGRGWLHAEPSSNERNSICNRMLLAEREKKRAVQAGPELG